MQLLIVAGIALTLPQGIHETVTALETDMELVRAGRIAKLTANDIKQMSGELRDDIKQSATARRKAKRMRFNGLIDRDLAIRIARKVKIRASGGAAGKYYDDWNARRQFLSDTIIAQARVIIDQRVRLTCEQAKSVGKLLESRWEYPEHYPVELLSYGMPEESLDGPWPRGFRNTRLQLSLRGELAEVQTEAFDWNARHIDQMASVNQFQLTKEALESVAQQQTSVLIDRYNLAGGAARNVRLAMKKAKSLGWEHHTASIEASTNNPRGPFAPHVIESLSFRPADAIRCDTLWESLIANSLTPEDREVFDAERQARAKRAHMAMMRLVIVMITEDNPVTADEQTATLRLLIESVPIDPRGLRICPANYLKIAALPPKAVSDAIGVRNYPGFRKWIGDATRPLKKNPETWGEAPGDR